MTNPGNHHVNLRGDSRLIGWRTVLVIADFLELFDEFRALENTFVNEGLCQGLGKEEKAGGAICDHMRFLCLNDIS